MMAQLLTDIWLKKAQTGKLERMMINFYQLLFSSLLIVMATSALPRKPFNLTILSLVGMTGSFPKEGKTCMVAQNFVLNEINSRGDILPDYHITAEFADEGPASYYAPKAVASYTRRMEDLWNQKPESPNAYQSPIIAGLQFTPACKTLGKFVHHFAGVIVAKACLGSIYTADRRDFPNLYRTTMSAELNNYVMIAFIKSNGWSKVGLYANADNQYNTMIAMHFHDVATKNGICLIWFDVASGINQDVVISMKQSGARIFVIQIVELPVVYKMLCLAYVNGLHGPRYVFFFGVIILSDPNLLPDIVDDNCTRAMIIDVYRSILTIGTASIPFINNGNVSQLHYDLESFDAKFKRFAGWTQPPIDADDRVGCHDNMVQVVFGLDRAEKMLSATSMTLRDLRKYPFSVMQVANESVAQTDFIGLRVGRVKYSKRLEIEDEPYYVTSRKSSSGYQVHYRILRKINSSVDDISAYVMENSTPINWSTQSCLPPFDFARFRRGLDVLADGVLLCVTIFATFSAIAKAIAIGGFASFMFFRQTFSIADNKYTIAVNVVFLSGCIILDGAAVAFVYHVHDFGDHLCLARPFLLAIGLGVITATYFIRPILLRKSVRENAVHAYARAMCRKYHRIVPALNVVNPVVSRRQSSIRRNGVKLSKDQERLTICITFCIVLVNVATLLAQTLLDPPLWKKSEDSCSTFYDEASDTFTKSCVEACESTTQKKYLVALSVLHAALLLIGCYSAFRIRHADFAHLADKFHCIGVGNITTIVAASVCIFFLVEKIHHAQEITVSCCAIVVPS